MCAEGVQITNGPLNATYLVEVDRTRYFIRERLIDDAEYGQTFAGERYVYEYFANSEVVRIPPLRRVVLDDARLERFAIFDAVDGTDVNWTSADDFTDLLQALRVIHSVPGQRLGNVRGPFSTEPVETYISAIFKAEVARIAPDSPLAELRAGFAAALPLASVFAGESVCLCHGDVQAHNFMRDRNGRFWTIDWEAARFRVAAADFNQFQHGWLDDQIGDMVICRYASLSERPVRRLLTQITFLRMLWHVRTFNFETLVRGRPSDDHELSEHVTGARLQLAYLDQADT